jgi:hypothetical protein
MIADTPKIDLKVLAAPTVVPSGVRSAASGTGGASIQLERAIPVFHRWIQERALDELMVDVADYTHVPEGPGVVLVCHDAIYALDGGGGELGLLYRRRRETHPSLGAIATLDDRLVSVFRRALAACVRLEGERDLAGLRFAGDRFELAVNDRRVTRTEADELAAALDRVAGWLFPGERAAIEITGGDGDRLAATLRHEHARGVTELLARLEVAATTAGAS